MSSLCFIALAVLDVDPDYKLAVSPEDLEALELPTERQPLIGSEVLVLTLLSIRDVGPATANLLAPLVINLANRRGLQAIRRDNLYSHEQALVAMSEECSC